MNNMTPEQIIAEIRSELSNLHQHLDAVAAACEKDQAAYGWVGDCVSHSKGGWEVTAYFDQPVAVGTRLHIDAERPAVGNEAAAYNKTITDGLNALQSAIAQSDAVRMLSAAALSGDDNAIKLAAQIAGAKPCGQCGYVVDHCKCQPDQRSSQWLPIDTAPKDGTVILLGLPIGGNLQEGARGVYEGRWHERLSTWASVNGLLLLTYASHWMPLPSAPNISVEVGTAKRDALKRAIKLLREDVKNTGMDLS